MYCFVDCRHLLGLKQNLSFHGLCGLLACRYAPSVGYNSIVLLIRWHFVVLLYAVILCLLGQLCIYYDTGFHDYYT